MTAPSWRPDVYARRKPFLRARQRIVRALRAWFDGEGFVEVETPVLQASPGGEVHLRPFKTELCDPHGGARKPLYLQTSPEFAMKKLLVAGEEKLFQIAHAYRNGEKSRLHHPEFTMVEWYRANADTAAIKNDCVALVRAGARAGGASFFESDGAMCDPFGEWEEISVADAFARHANIDLLATAPDPHRPDATLLRKAMEPLSLRTAPDDRWEDLFFRVMGEKIEPHLGRDRPTFLCDYPISMAALARPLPHDPRVAERFELYIAGIEIANAFGELTDADEQLRRFETDSALRKKLYGDAFPIDRDFIAALRHGMPQAAGIALGLDRLVMLCSKARHIEDVLWLPVFS